MMKYSQAPILPKKYLAIGLAEKRSVGASSFSLSGSEPTVPFGILKYWRSLSWT
jgi:hypothetical protein